MQNYNIFLCFNGLLFCYLSLIKSSPFHLNSLTTLKSYLWHCKSIRHFVPLRTRDVKGMNKNMMITKRSFKICTLFILGIVPAGGCSNGNAFPAEDPPACIQDKIKSLQKEAVRNPPAAVIRYSYRGETVYYIPSSAGDRFSELYGSDCRLICHPDGGITGRGDGKCSDFSDQRSAEQIIWEDKRK